MKTLGPERRELKEEVGCCMCCREPLQPEWLDVHEIASGPAREKCLTEPLLQLVVCRDCHHHVQSQTAAKQIAWLFKWLIEKTCEKYCELKGYAPTAVVPADVHTFLMYQKAPKKRHKVKK